MQAKIEKQPKATIKMTVTVEAEKVKEAYGVVLEQKVKTTKVEGFREGKAPQNLVEEKVGISALHSEVVNLLLQMYYPQAVKENHVMPISNPKVEIKEFDMEKPFEFVAEVAVRPEVKIKSTYKKTLKKKLDDKNKTLKKENTEKLKKGEEMPTNHAHLEPTEIIDALLESSEVEIADLLIDEEIDRMMSRLVNQAQSIGLSLEQYLKAQNKTIDELRGDYQKMSERNLKAEFVLGHLVEEEKVEVGDTEIDEAFIASGVPVDQLKSQDPRQRLYVKVILQKNKLVGKLIEEIEGKKPEAKPKSKKGKAKK